MTKIYMVLCPNCRSIQKRGTTCGCCGYPIPEQPPLKNTVSVPLAETVKKK